MNLTCGLKGSFAHCFQIFELNEGPGLELDLWKQRILLHCL
jgi:hypothetical protein